MVRSYATDSNRGDVVPSAADRNRSDGNRKLDDRTLKNLDADLSSQFLYSSKGLVAKCFLDERLGATSRSFCYILAGLFRHRATKREC